MQNLLTILITVRAWELGVLRFQERFLLEILALVNESEQTALTAISTNGYLDYQLMDETIDNFNNPIMFAILRLRKQDDALAQAEKSITRDTIDPRV